LSGIENSTSKWNNKGIDLSAEFAVLSLNHYGSLSPVNYLLQGKADIENISS